MLKQKLLRLDESVINELEQLAHNLSEKEYISFSSLVRKLIKIGMENMETTENNFLGKIQELSNGNSANEKVLQHIKSYIKDIASLGRKDYSFTLRAFNREVERSLGMLDNSDLIASAYIEILEYVISSLRKEGIEIKLIVTQHNMIQFNIYR
jgi:hypothetical protein